MRAPEGGVAARLMRGERVVHLVDAMNYDSYPVSSLRGLIEAGGVRTMVTVQLVKGNELLGIILAFRQEVRPFTDKQIALLQNFAAQAVIAMENARLVTETREALDQQTATAEVLQVINSSPGDLAPVFDAMLEKAMRLCEAAFGFLSTYDGEYFHAVALRGVPQNFAEGWLGSPYRSGPNTTHDRLIRGERLVHVPDLAADRVDDPRRRAVLEVAGVRSILGVPLRKEGALLGAIHIYRQEVRVGIVPVGMLAALVQGDWADLIVFVIFIILTFGLRALAFWLATKADERTARLSFNTGV
jgi:GAF domain-containing protein